MNNITEASKKSRILILDASQRSALAVTRSLGKHHIHLYTADETSSALAGCSRHSHHYFTYPSQRIKPNQFSSAIMKHCKKEKIDIIIPMTELTTSLILELKSKLQTITIPLSTIETISFLSNKYSLINLSKTLGVPIPKTLHINSIDELPNDLPSFSYPVILKSDKSWVNYKGQWIHTTVRTANSSSEAKEIIFSDLSFKATSFMIQEFIPGKGAGLFTLYDKGNPIAFFAHNRLREKPPQGGVSVLSESTAVDPILEKYSRALLGHVNWHGVAMVEFRITPEGKPYLMEINTRFWGSLQLAIDAGVDFPWLLYQTCIQDNKDRLLSQNNSTSDYKVGVRLRWILGDLDSLYLVLRNPETSFATKLKKIVAFLTPHPFITRHEVNRMADFKPFIWELKQYLKALVSG